MTVVITASQTFAATANAIVHCGATPVFVDSEVEHWTMNPALLDAACKTAQEQGHRIGAIIPVDLYGQCAAYAHRLQSQVQRGRAAGQRRGSASP